MSLVAGTPLYLSPQAAQAQPPSPKDDIWAVGCIAYELLFGRNPFSAAQSLPELMAAIVKGIIAPPPSDAHVSDAAKAFVFRLLTVDEAARPTAEELLKDPWLEPALNADYAHLTRTILGQSADGRTLPDETTSRAAGPESSRDRLQPAAAAAPNTNPSSQPNQNLLPPLTLFSETFSGNRNHAFAVTGAQVVFDSETGELRVVADGSGMNNSVQS